MATPNLFGLKAAPKEDNTRDAPPTGEAGGGASVSTSAPVVEVSAQQEETKEKPREEKQKSAPAPLYGGGEDVEPGADPVTEDEPPVPAREFSVLSENLLDAVIRGGETTRAVGFLAQRRAMRARKAIHTRLRHLDEALDDFQVSVDNLMKARKGPQDLELSELYYERVSANMATAERELRQVSACIDGAGGDAAPVLKEYQDFFREQNARIEREVINDPKTADEKMLATKLAEQIRKRVERMIEMVMRLIVKSPARSAAQKM
ncbi:hypothetical protein [Thiolapillus sp.]|uniref:hypothetical protein n=1 Tax=Thiolapillus sp. TaxID=2017437 RepID=UPI0025E5D702|nr:hypothetical protein [Thiolapillus sp.]